MPKAGDPCPSMYLCTGSDPDAVTEEFPVVQKHARYIYQKPITLDIIKEILIREKSLEPISANQGTFLTLAENSDNDPNSILYTGTFDQTPSAKLFELNTGAVLESQLRTECLRHELFSELEG